ncbi:hypothetical protein A2Z00_03715 [Candidatus Gottesmanbacteria bacterium RBG_13_45_10]|uniref:Transposase IS200-like domain-containing protein n=1 Tax=Candidatus Gottesmanbacteria bacterium RBG_13_45_10 TaxID=1798370 RepID=A0A1F5ZET0_9BACT|nr:MAG: hypothetical protein A2Z00_03715 [Candidatus Gottesmanbacteria bacterium RBG_13_45_10]
MLNQEERQKILLNSNTADKRLVEIICYVFMPNHFHLLVKQTREDGIRLFVARALNSYTRYSNTKRKRVGTLFQGTFKAVRVEDDEQLIHLSRYIHLNPLVSYVVKDADFLTYPWSSLPDYLQNNTMGVSTQYILSHFRSQEEYKQFVLDQVDYAKKLQDIKHLTFDH